MGTGDRRPERTARPHRDRRVPPVAALPSIAVITLPRHHLDDRRSVVATRRAGLVAAVVLLLVGCAGGGGSSQEPAGAGGASESGDAADPDDVGDAADPGESDAADADDGGDDGDDDGDVEVPAIDPEVDALDAAAVTLTRGDGADVSLAVRVADDDASRARGLMEVEDLPDGTGMLFTWGGEERDGGFWMKDTLIALDIAFAGAEGDIREILTMEPCEADPCPVYDPEVSYTEALEVPAGWFGDQAIEVGDELTWERVR